MDPGTAPGLADAARAFPMWEVTKDVVDEFIDLLEKHAPTTRRGTPAAVPSVAKRA